MHIIFVWTLKNVSLCWRNSIFYLNWRYFVLQFVNLDSALEKIIAHTLYFCNLENLDLFESNSGWLAPDYCFNWIFCQKSFENIILCLDYLKKYPIFCCKVNMIARFNVWLKSSSLLSTCIFFGVWIAREWVGPLERRGIWSVTFLGWVVCWYIQVEGASK